MIRAALEKDGFCILPHVLLGGEIGELIRALESVASGLEYSRSGKAYAMRDVFEQLPRACELVSSRAIREIVEPILGENCFAVRGLLFDKTTDANWKVPFHQDLTICVQEKIDAPKFGPWSEKSGVVCVQPPTEILESMFALRLHMDDCDENDGALRVLPSSHKRGKLSASEIKKWRETTPEKVCPVPAGGVLLMRPLLLHASSLARNPIHRRVLHFEFAAGDLPHGLKWHWRVGTSIS